MSDKELEIFELCERLVDLLGDNNGKERCSSRW